MVDTQKIKKEVLALCEESRTLINIDKEIFINEMKHKYEYLFTNSSTLFDRCTKGDLNIEHLNFMLAMLDKVNSGCDFQKTSIEVGQHLTDAYVKPLIENK